MVRNGNDKIVVPLDDRPVERPRRCTDPMLTTAA